MASSSSGQQKAFSAIENQGERRQVSESSQLYDVFINHRGPDVKQTLALKLYNYLQDHGFRAFLDSEEKELGKSFPSTIETAISSAAVQIAIFSRGYAKSAWCLAELVEMVKSKAMIIPVFYGVEPWELRHIEKGRYAHAFSNYHKKGRYSKQQLEKWKEALHSASLLAGHKVDYSEVDNSNDENSEVDNSEVDNSNVENSKVDNSEEQILSFKKLCEVIEPVVKNQVQRAMPLYVAKYPVRLEESVEHFETQCGMKEEGKGKAKIIGIYAMGGSGKTTLSKELFNRWRSEYTRACFLYDVREACNKNELPSLQKTLLRELFGEVYPSLHSVQEGTTHLSHCLSRSSNLNFLIVLDDIDKVEQLDDLLVMDMVEKSTNGLVIVTTRDEGVLRNAGIELRYKLPGIAKSSGRELFCWYAFHQSHPDHGYEQLVNDFVEVCRGVPLALRVLGAHVHGEKEKTFWKSALNRARETMPQGILQTLQISFDSLEDNEKDIFMDIACFFLQKPRSIGIRVWDRSEWHAEHAVKILKRKCLIEKIESSSGLCEEDRVAFGMHDHLRDLGREMAKKRRPRRLWRPQDLKRLESKGFPEILAGTNGRCFHSFFDSRLDSKITFFSEKCDGSVSLLWLQLEGEFRGDTSIPSCVPLQDLECLRISNPHLKRLWQSNVQGPDQLKDLHIYKNSLEEFSDLLGISSDLENLMLDADKMKVEGWSLLVSLRIIPVTLSLKSSTLSGQIAFNNEGGSSLVIWNFKVSGKVAFTNGRESTPIMSRLKELEVDNEKKVTKVLIDGNHCSSLEDLRLNQMTNLTEVNLKRVKTLSCLIVNKCRNLRSLSGISGSTKLAELDISECPMLELELCLAGLKCLERIRLDNSIKLKRFELNSCKNLKVISGFFFGRVLRVLSIRDCPELDLEELHVPDPNNIESIVIDGCRNIGNLKLRDCQNLKSVSASGNFDLVGLWIRDCPKLQSISLSTPCSLLKLKYCKELKRVTATSHRTKLVSLKICECPKLEELSSLGPFRCVKRIIIECCEKLQDVAGIEEVHPPEIMRLSNCGNAAVRKFINKLEGLLLIFGAAIGRAVDGAESILNPHLFFEVIGTDAVTEIDCKTYMPCSRMKSQALMAIKQPCNSLSAIIVCAVVNVDSSVSRQFIYAGFLSYAPYALSQGTWIVTFIISWEELDDYHWIESDVTKKACVVSVKAGQEAKALLVLQRIVHKLYDK